ncbi:MAG TPA: DNA/RNA nuclease SfsA [Desulfomonilaceae bacterium]|nr:DNA/RNA nuclease SfsA [Desulfomonilaceae bacterium]
MLVEEAVNTCYSGEEIREIERTLGYTFGDPSHLMNALTRRSYWHENRETCKHHNERLEFLGDAVLGLVVADILYREFPDDEEGELQKKRASLVNRAALAQLMRKLDLSEFIRMGRGDELSGCRNRDSILADTLEALVAAVYKDGGFAAAENMIQKHFYPLIMQCSTRDGLEDCKSQLQELAQADLGITPTYEMVDQWGEEHRKTFSVAVYLGAKIAGRGTGRNKREAAQNAAKEALLQLKSLSNQDTVPATSGSRIESPVEPSAVSSPPGALDSTSVSAESLYTGLPWPKLVRGTLIRRYKRFIADVKLRTGEIVTAHCPNSGSMLGCCEPGRPVYLSRSDNPHRRLLYTWEMIRLPSSLVGVNTLVPNKLVKHAIISGRIPELSGYESVRSEIRCGSHSRLDLILEHPGKPSCYLEVKNSTLVEDGVAYFPDAVTTRGLRHLEELQELVRQGNRGVIFFLVHRSDATAFRPADHIHPEYGKTLRAAVRNGIEIQCYDVIIDLKRIAINNPVPCLL